MDLFNLSIFIAGTALIVAISWRSLFDPGFHGFYRFFAFEAILCIIVLNARVWFREPLSDLQLVSWPLLTISLVLALHGFYLLHQRGQPSNAEPDSPLFRIENTSSLVTTGAYRFIRHPLYASLLCFAWGAALKSLTLLTAVLAGVATVALVATAKSEEAENIARFGESYREYMARTRLFIPFIY